jgi:hypothetical protein
LRDELLDGFGEGVEVHLEALGERLGHEEFVGQDRAGSRARGRTRASCGRRSCAEDGAAGQAIASGAADLLVEGFERAGQRGVDDGADVGLVDAHAEGDGGDDDFELAGLEGVLDALADARFEAGVVGGGGEVAMQLGGEFFGRFARWA